MYTHVDLLPYSDAIPAHVSSGYMKVLTCGTYLRPRPQAHGPVYPQVCHTHTLADKSMDDSVATKTSKGTVYSRHMQESKSPGEQGTRNQNVANRTRPRTEEPLTRAKAPEVKAPEPRI